jgi:hypothetical protein
MEAHDGNLFGLNDLGLRSRIELDEANDSQPASQSFEGMGRSLARSTDTTMSRSNPHNPFMLLDFDSG